MVIADFQIEDKLSRARFLQESFLLADTSIEVVLKMLFLIFSNGNIQFAEKKPIWKFCIAVEALPTIKQVEPIDKKKFAKTALDEKYETLVAHVLALDVLLAEIIIYLLWEVQISTLI